MDKYIILITILLVVGNLNAQENSDSSAFKYKLNYNVPESPAFAILDANPNKVTRGSAAQEVVINFANSIIAENKLTSGVAVDFNPYFVLGGRLKNIEEYRGKPLKRILANTQLSCATTSDDSFPNDLFVSSGLRITLFDSKDLLQNNNLGKRIDDALAPVVVPDSVPDSPFGHDSDEVVSNRKLLKAYTVTKKEMMNARGGAISIGAATSGRFLNSDFMLDSLMRYRDQLWLSAQYSFGNGFDLMGIAMYRNNFYREEKSVGEVQLGVGMKYLTNSINIGGEVVYSTKRSNLDVSLNIEATMSDRIILYASIGNRSELDLDGEENKIRIFPGIKYNLSESGK